MVCDVRYRGAAERASSWFRQTIGRTASRKEEPRTAGRHPTRLWGARKEHLSLERQSHYRHPLWSPLKDGLAAGGALVSDETKPISTTARHVPEPRLWGLRREMSSPKTHTPCQSCTQGIMQLPITTSIPRRGLRNIWLHGSGRSMNSWVLYDYGSSKLL